MPNFTDLIAPQLSSSDDRLSFKAQWGISSPGDAWKYVDSWWEFYRPWDDPLLKKKSNGERKPWDLKHFGLGGSSTSDDCDFNRNDARADWRIYPLGPWRIDSVVSWVQAKDKNNGKATQWFAAPRLTIRKPPEPTIEFAVERSQDGSNTDLKVTVKKGQHPQAYMNAECDNYRTVTKITVDSNTAWAQLATDKTTGQQVNWTPRTSDAEFTISAGTTFEQGLKYNQWARVTVESYGQGCAGDGPRVVKSRIFAHPARAQINSVAIDEGAGIVMVDLSTNQSEFHPVDSVKLQRLKDSEWQTPGAAAEASGWQDVQGMTDTGNCEGLSDSVTDARPAKGKRTWYRVVSQHDDYVAYSEPVESGMYRPEIEAQPGAASILSATSGEDGQSAIVDIAWDNDAFVNVTDPAELAKYKSSTQITWAKTEYAWQSTESLEEFNVPWEDPTPREPTKAHSARVFVAGLDEGEPVFVRVRRVIDTGEDTVNGPWSEVVMVTPVTSPGWVELEAPRYIARGQALPLSWTFGSEAAQTGWNIIDSNGKIWANGTDAESYCIIGAEALEGVSELTLSASITTGGEWKTSKTSVTVKIVEAPTLSVTAPETVTALPLAISGDTEDGTLINYYLVSRGIVYAAPEGAKTQYANDIVWSHQARPGALEVKSIPLKNGCTYDLRAQAVSADTGLASAEVCKIFTVGWERRAPLPQASVSVDADTLESTITTVSTDGMATTDTYEVYRLTKDGCYLIAQGLKPGAVVTDRFAPFSAEGNSYRIAVRTADGDCAWSDFDYTLEASGLRLDWGDSHVALDYNIEISEGMAKDFEARKHLDGSVEGFWDDAVEHQAKFSTDIIRFESLEQQRLLREVARHAGAVFVRTASGLAFDANVEVEEISEACSSGVIGVSLSIQEINLTAAHACTMGDIVEPLREDEPDGKLESSQN